MNEYHLVKHFSKPKEGEYVPVTFIELKQKLVAWSPVLKRSVYLEKEDDTSSLKRVREINLMIAVNHLSGSISSIELTDEERFAFEKVYETFLNKGGQLMYTRKKIDKKLVSTFEVWVNDRNLDDSPEKSLLSERM